MKFYNENVFSFYEMSDRQAYDDGTSISWIKRKKNQEW